MLKRFSAESLRADLLAGSTTAAVVIPKAMAYGAIAGVALVVGLYTSLVLLVIYALLGSSRTLSVTTTTTIAILTAGALGEAVPGGERPALLAASATLTLLVGAGLLLGGFLRLGAVANLISDPVLTGFKAGIGLVIVIDQIPKLLGVHIAKAGFFRDLFSILGQVPEASAPTILLAALMVALMLGFEHYAPRFPAPLITVAIGIAVSYYMDLASRGVELVGAIEAGLPAFAMPDLSLVQRLWPAAVGIAVMSFVETAATGRAFIRRGDPPPAANRELLATGAANIVGSAFGSMPGGGGTSQTLVNYVAGARSQVSGLVTAAWVAATLLFLAPLFGMMPHATLAAVVIVASIGLVDPAEFRAILRIRSIEFHWALAAMIGVLLLGTLKGILVAVLMSLVALIIRANRHPLLVLGRKPGTNVFRPLTPEHPEDQTFPGLLMLRPSGGLYFANTPRLGQELRTLYLAHRPKVVLLDLCAVPDLEFTALRMISDGEEKLREAGARLWLAALNLDVLRVVQRSPLGERLGREGMFFTLEQALAKYQSEAAASR